MNACPHFEGSVGIPEPHYERPTIIHVNVFTFLPALQNPNTQEIKCDSINEEEHADLRQQVSKHLVKKRLYAKPCWSYQLTLDKKEEVRTVTILTTSSYRKMSTEMSCRLHLGRSHTE